jgi:hypothetical protein
MNEIEKLEYRIKRIEILFASLSSSVFSIFFFFLDQYDNSVLFKCAAVFFAIASIYFGFYFLIYQSKIEQKIKKHNKMINQSKVV